MSNPTELPDRADFEAWAKVACNMPNDAKVNWHADWTKAAFEGWQAAFARRAQPEGEAPQADPEQPNGGMHDSIFVKVWGDAGGGDAGRRKLAEYAYALGKRASATLSPLCGAHHAEGGKEAQSAYEILLEVCRGGALALIELRSMVSDPEHVAFINRALANPQAFAAQLDGGQEGSESNG